MSREDDLIYRGPLPTAKPKQQPTKHPLAGRTPGVRSTSRQAFFNDVKPKLTAKQQVVYVAVQMAEKPLNNAELSKYLGWPINTVTPRVNELVEQGRVEEAFRDVYPATGRRTIYWRVAR